VANPLVARLTSLIPFRQKQTLSSVGTGNGGWFPLIRESFGGSWQRNLEIDQSTALSYYAIFACTTLIASDIAKLRPKLVQLQDNVWTETTNPAYSPVLNNPNPIQSRVQFWESWFLSKLTRGNTYVLKVRDARNVVSDLYVLNPNRVTPLVSDDGQVFYRLQADNVAGIKDSIVVPAREIIHDRWNCLFHPLVGISPIYANNLAATHGIRIQQNSVAFFSNASNPGGILTAPDHIPRQEAEEMKERWEENFAGNNLGRIAVLGNGLTFQTTGVTALDAQLIEQGKWTAEIVCATFHVPPYKISIGEPPKYNNIQALNVEYYSQCLQYHIESAEVCLDDGLGLGSTLGIEFDVENLLRMDSLLMAEYVTKLTGGGVLEINEARKKFNLGPTEGGDTAYLQQQNYSLAALAKRDASADPFLSTRETYKPPPGEVAPGSDAVPTASPPPPPTTTANGKDLLANAIAARYLKRLMYHVNDSNT
jgi:HK97 family phage portal protein